MDYYILLGLNRKEYKIVKIEKEKNKIEVELESKKGKVRCPSCKKYTKSIHSKLKPIKSVYLDSCDQSVNLIIQKRRFHCYNCGRYLQKKWN